jgi:WD40 repeat protein
MLDEPFQKYLSSRIKWTDSSAVRDLEYNGDLFIMNLSSQFREGIKERMRSETMCSNLSKQRYRSIRKKIEIDTKYHWKLARHPDTLHRRILLVPNRCFDDHASASYDLALGIERDHALLVNQDRLYSANNNDLMKMVKVAQEGIVKRNIALCQEIVSDVINDNLDLDDDVSIESIADANLSEKDELITDWDRLEFERESEAASPKKKGTHDWSKEFIWASNEKFIKLFDDVQIVTVNAVVVGEIVLSTHNIYFRPTDDPISVVTKEKVDSKRKEDIITDDGRWRLSRLQQVHGRRFMLRAQAVELFFADTHQLFLNFRNGPKIRDTFVEKLRQCRIPLLSSIPISLNPRVLFKKKFSTLTESWKERKISNFEYLMELNIIAGRTFNDISQYPVFPWVIADYESEQLDLKKQSTFRDLSKPIGALNPDRLAQFIQRYHDLDGLPDDEKFLYGSHYSSPGVVLHYLIRQEPFTSMAIDLQSGRFDCPDRLFYNIGACWKSCLSSTSDVKELVPELFTCPEVLLNTNNYPLGKTQSRMSISNVILPPWANGSAYEFIRLHRLALESEYVSSNLHHWIDLIFGYKQRGIEAIKANNVFHFLSYEGSVDLNRITDEIDRAATESQIQNFGQVPYQLLCTEPHPQRYARDKCWMPVINELEGIRRLTCYTPVKQFNSSNNQGIHGSVLSIQILPEYVVVIYADLNVGMYKWSPYKHGNTPFYLRMDKMRPIVTKEMSISSFSMGLREKGQTNYDKIRGRDIGNWSFALTINDKIHAKASRSVGLTKTKDVSSSSIDVTLLSCGYCDNTLKAHTLDGLRLKSSETGGHSGQINCIRLAEDGTLLVTGGDDATVRVWTVENPNMAVALIDSYIQTAQGPVQKSNALSCCLVLWGHGRSVISLACSSALDIVVSGSQNGMICIHTIRRGTFIRSIDASDFLPSERVINSGLAIQNLALHSDGIFVAYLESGLLQMYTINGVKLACVDCGEKLNAMEIIPGSHSLVTGGDSGHVIIRSIRDLEIQYILDLSDYGAICCVSFTPPPSKNTKSIHQFMLVGSFDGSITVVCSEREYESEECNDGDESQDSCASDSQTATGRARYIQHHSKTIQKHDRTR